LFVVLIALYIPFIGLKAHALPLVVVSGIGLVFSLFPDISDKNRKWLYRSGFLVLLTAMALLAIAIGVFMIPSVYAAPSGLMLIGGGGSLLIAMGYTILKRWGGT
jgi:hypothetical protein